MTVPPIEPAEVGSKPGYARWPALGADAAFVVADGSVWRLDARGATSRLTERARPADRPAVSPCGRWLAYGARAEGATEVHVLPLAGGPARRLTDDGLHARVCGWHPDGRVLYATQADVPLARWRLFLIDTDGHRREPLALDDAVDGCFVDAQRLVFVQGGLLDDHARRYRGGARSTLWLVDLSGDQEARPLWAEEGPAGACWSPRWDGQRLLFLHDDDTGVDLAQARPSSGAWPWQRLTQVGDVQAFAARAGACLLTRGGALARLREGALQPVATQLPGELPGLAPQPVPRALRCFETAVAAEHEAGALLRVRGRLWRLAPGGHDPVEWQLPGGRAFACALAADGSSAFVVCDTSGEPEIWQVFADDQPARRLTHDGGCNRTGLWPSPCGRWLAHADARHRLWRLDLATLQQQAVPLGPTAAPVQSLAWQPDGAGFVATVARELVDRPQLEHVGFDGGEPRLRPLTDGRYACHSPVMSADGHWLFFLSEREFNAPRSHPWGDRAFGVAFDRRTRCDALALVDGACWPWDDPAARAQGRPAAAGELRSVPLPAGNHQRLWLGEGALLAWDMEPGSEPEAGGLVRLPLAPGAQPQTLPRRWAFVGQGRRHAQTLVREAGDAAAPLLWLAADGNTRPALDERWSLVADPRREWAQHLRDAWRHVREHMYDGELHGVDWAAIGARHARMLCRVTERSEVDDVIGHMLAELGTLHTFVHPAPADDPPASEAAAFIGADVSPAEDGLRVERVLDADPACPDRAPPAAAPEAGLRPGDVIVAVAGRPAAGAAGLGPLLRGKAQRRVLLDLRGADGHRWRAAVQPVAAARGQELRHADWLAAQQARVAARSEGRIGYLHLRAMRRADLESFVREAWADPHRQGLLIDVRGNRGGNVESWIVEKLRREAWLWWSRPHAPPDPNMPGTLHGHVAVLIDAQTYSDGETFAAAVRHFGIGPLVGTRTSGAGVWLVQQPNLVDRGTVTVGQFGQFDSAGRWVIEGHGVEPDVEVRNGPRAAFEGRDAQLDAALALLQDRIRARPHVRPQLPSPPRGLR